MVQHYLQPYNERKQILDTRTVAMHNPAACDQDPYLMKGIQGSIFKDAGSISVNNCPSSSRRSNKLLNHRSRACTEQRVSTTSIRAFLLPPGAVCGTRLRALSKEHFQSSHTLRTTASHIVNKLRKAHVPTKSLIWIPFSS